MDDYEKKIAEWDKKLVQLAQDQPKNIETNIDLEACTPIREEVEEIVIPETRAERILPTERQKSMEEITCITARPDMNNPTDLEACMQGENIIMQQQELCS